MHTITQSSTKNPTGLSSTLVSRLAPLRARYEALQPREQVLVGIAAVLLVIALLYSAIWQPLARARKQLADDLEAAHAVAIKLAQAEAAAAMAARNAGVRVRSSSEVSR